jgi:hypothetical protein
VRIAGPRHEHLSRAHATEKIAELFGEFVLMTAQFTVAELEFEPICSRHSKGVEGLMPFTVTNLGDIVRARSRPR